MDRLTKIRRKLRKDQQANTLLTAVYFGIALIEVVAEYQKDIAFVYASKPLIILILIFLYWKTSTKLNYFYLTALFFSWLANIFFVAKGFESIFIGSMLFFIYRILIIYIVLKHVRLPGIFPMVIGGLPFLSVYLYIINLTYHEIGQGLLIFIFQCLLISFLGGVSVGNYILRSSRANTFLLLSTLCFALTQFIFVARLYFTEFNFFQPLAMILFVVGQYLFYRFLLLAEKRKAGYKIVNDSGIYS